MRAFLSASVFSANVLAAGVLFLLGCQPAAARSQRPVPQVKHAGEAVATFAGGCFWCMEPPYEGLRGVRSVVSGYTGGDEKDPTYKQVSSGSTGHTEAVQVVFDPQVISYATLVEIFWRSMDPTDGGGQFADRGTQYRPGIFYHDEDQRKAALASKAALEKSGRFDKPIAVELTAFKSFYPAEDYHQDYYRTNTAHYKAYRKGSGREGFLRRTWPDQDEFERKLVRYGKPPVGELRKKLDDLQFEVTQEEGTEPPFKNEYWNNGKSGIYVDVVSGEPLFSSRDKFKSGTGWPSFVRPLIPENIVEVTDRRMIVPRVEVRSKHGDSHLGHVFTDGPAPTGLRYCINSAALKFIPVEELAAKGYGHFARAFGDVATGKSTKVGTTSQPTSQPTSRPAKKD